MWQKTIPLTQRANFMPNEESIARGRRRLAHWRTKSVLADEATLAARLAADGLTEDEFVALLGAPDSHSGAGAAPDWYALLEELYTGKCAATNSANGDLQEPVVDEPNLSVLQPLLAWGFAQFDNALARLVQEVESVPFAPHEVRSFLMKPLTDRLKALLNRALVLQVNIARMLEQLQGDTPAERYAYFMHELACPARAWTFLNEYPLLAQMAVRQVEQWLEASLEFLERLCADWPQIQQTFGATEPGPLVKLSCDAGDSHRGGRAVMIARFASGFTLVYKPRPMAVDVHFQELLSWLNDQGVAQPFRTLTILAQADYGWMEFVEAAPCQSDAELRRYYMRLGGLIALLFVLEATDFHHENIIAAHDQPMLIDLESIFHPQEPLEALPAGAAMPAIRLLAQSVMRLGILPNRIWRTEEAVAGVDISGMNSTAGLLSPFAGPTLTDTDTDEVRVVYKRQVMKGAQNVPVAEGERVDLVNYAEEVATGFETIYRLMWAERDALLARNGPLSAFAHDPVRVIMRPTMVYGRLLFDAHHPNHLKDAREQSLLFDKLWTMVKDQPKYAHIVAAEQKALQIGDVPLFTTQPSSRILTDGNGFCAPTYWPSTGLEQVTKRLHQMSEDDLARQLWFIRGSIASSAINLDLDRRSRRLVTGVTLQPTRETLLPMARAIGDHLLQLALHDEEFIGWLGINSVDEEHMVLEPVGLALYDGLPGMVLFLAHLARETGDSRYAEAARKALATLESMWRQEPDMMRAVGGFSGWGGLIYLYVQLAQIWDDGSRLEAAVQMAPQIAQRVEIDNQYDVISGAAGAILALAALHSVCASAEVVQAIDKCAAHLLRHAQPMSHGVGWLLKGMGEQALTGFSHGAAGIALALLEAAAITSKREYRETALQALAYERTLFDAEMGNWPDLRQTNDEHAQPSCMTAWCHGAPGIGLSRLAMLRHLDDATLRNEIDVALRATIALGVGYNQSLCHGDLGNLELLLVNRERNPELCVDDILMEFSGQILNNLDTHGWRCGVPMEVETPGLMTGLAGIGYQLLRLAAPERVPSVLLLGLPR
ncbi:MAG: type 2 lantipeptide synthetase LanM family protein [Caldilineaceae bacterium]|nr:type 2 lantipeptide synthetase LanM family protein [Caldilineaceae bacterium]MCB0140736.1 type 2 lantipeptide synthetase LanM family protein [Caldilineaceae bacterium]